MMSRWLLPLPLPLPLHLALIHTPEWRASRLEQTWPKLRVAALLEIRIVCFQLSYELGVKTRELLSSFLILLHHQQQHQK